MAKALEKVALHFNEAMRIMWDVSNICDTIKTEQVRELKKIINKRVK